MDVSSEMRIRRWSLSFRSEWVYQVSFGAKSVEQNVTSIAERISWVELRCVGALRLFKRTKWLDLFFDVTTRVCAELQLVMTSK